MDQYGPRQRIAAAMSFGALAAMHVTSSPENFARFVSWTRQHGNSDIALPDGFDMAAGALLAVELSQGAAITLDFPPGII